MAHTRFLAPQQASKAAFGDSCGVPQVTRVPIDLGDVSTLEASLEAVAVAVSDTRGTLAVFRWQRQATAP